MAVTITDYACFSSLTMQKKVHNAKTTKRKSKILMAFELSLLKLLFEFFNKTAKVYITKKDYSY